MKNLTLRDVVEDARFFENARARAQMFSATDSVTRGLLRDGVFKNAGTFKRHFTEVIEKQSSLSAAKRNILRHIGMHAANKTYQQIMSSNENR